MMLAASAMPRIVMVRRLQGEISSLLRLLGAM